MAILKKTIQPTAGLNYVYDAAITFVKMIFVSLEDVQTDISTVTGNRMCNYSTAEGRIYFQNSFDGIQRVFLIYQV